MSPDTALISVEESWEMDVGHPVELVRGGILATRRSNTHRGFVCTKVGRYFDEWADKQNIGYVVSSDRGVLTKRNPDTMRGPDGYFIRHQRLPERCREVAPDLAVEKLSPGDRPREVWDKIQEYFALGVQEAWVIDPQVRQVHVMRPDDGPLIVPARGTLQSPELLPGFARSMASLLPPPSARPQEGVQVMSAGTRLITAARQRSGPWAKTTRSRALHCPSSRYPSQTSSRRHGGSLCGSRPTRHPGRMV